MKIRGGGQHLVQVLFNIIFPKKCQICYQKFDVLLCDFCVQKHFGILYDHILLDLKNTKLQIAFKYSEQILRLIKKGKFHGMRGIFEILMDYYLSENKYLKTNYDVIIPIPLHRRRLCERGYNQSTLIAKKIGIHINAVVNENILIRKKYTQQQACLNKQQRVKNLQNVFSIQKNNIEVAGLKILIVDDVYTTGTTFHEARKILLCHGAYIVDGFVLLKKDL